MKVLVRVDQKTAISRGIDAPSSTAKVEFDPKDLTQAQRDKAASLFQDCKDNWSPLITVVSPSVEELKAGLDLLMQKDQEQAAAQERAQQVREAQNARIEELAVDVRRRAIARDPAFLKEGVATVEDRDIFGRLIEVSYKGHYISVEGHQPEGADDSSFGVCSFGVLHDMNTVLTPHQLLMEASDKATSEFSTWQKELDRANKKARTKAVAEAARLAKDVGKQAKEFVRKNGTDGDRLRLREFDISEHLVTAVLKAKLLSDYRGSEDPNQTKVHPLDLQKLTDTDLGYFIRVRDTEILEGDTVTPGEGVTQRGYAIITREWLGTQAAVHLKLVKREKIKITKVKVGLPERPITPILKTA